MLSRFLLVAVVTASPILAFAGASDEKPERSSAVEVYNQGVRLMRSKKFRAAERKFQAALRDRPFAEAHNNLAYCLRKQGAKNYSRALQHYNRAIAMKPDMPEAYMYRGVLLMQLDRAEDARADLAKLKSLGSPLSSELAWVIEHGGKEKTPERFFGVNGRLSERR